MPPEVLRALGKLLIVFGAAVAVLGALLMWGHKLPFSLGRLPGDIVIRRENFTLYFPLGTCLVLSVVLSLLFWLWGRR